MNCCRCPAGVTPPACRTTITSADLAELVYIAGLDEDLCEKFQAVVEIFQLTDCAGNLIPGSTEIVTCADFQAQLCATVAALVSGDPIVLGVTELVGADCELYTIPTLCTQIAALAPGAASVPNVTSFIGADCLTHVQTETPITPIDTTTVNLTVSGTSNHTLQADVLIDPGITNLVTVGPGGIQVLCADVQDCVDICDLLAQTTFNGVAVPGVTKLVGADCFNYDLPPTGPDINIAVLDTACLDLSIVEAPAGTFLISGAPVISPNAGNQISCAGNGLFVPTPTGSDTVIQVVDNACIDLAVVEAPADTWTITPTLNISPNAGNVAQCLGNGLYVPEGTFDLDCVDVVATFIESAGPIPGGTTFLADDCNSYPLPVVTGLDTFTVDITVTPVTDDYQVSAEVIISPDYPGFPAGCNTLVETAAGLAALPEHTGLNFEIGDITHDTGALMEGGFFIFDDVVVLITNPSACRFMAVSIMTRMPEVYHVQGAALPDQRVRTHIQIDHEFNFPTAVPPLVFGPVIKSEWFLASDMPDPGDTAAQRIGNGNPGGTIINLLILPPGGSGTYTVSGVIDQVLGDTTEVNSAGLVVRVSGQTI